MKLSDTQSLILSKAAQHDWRLATPPKTLPTAARNAVFRSMLKHGLLAECTAPREYIGLGWRQDDEGTWIALRITDAGLRAIGIEPEGEEPVDTRPRDARNGVDPRLVYGDEGDSATVGDTAPTGAPDGLPQEDGATATEPAQAAPATPGDATRAEDLALLDQALAAPTPAPRTTLRLAAQAVLDAWDDGANREADIVGALEGPMERLRALLAAKSARTPRDSAAPRKPREGTKQEAVLAMLRRPEGATVAQIAEATGWAHHTVRGFFAGLKKKGINVAVLERVRQVGPNKEGAKGSYTIYRIAD